MTSLSPTRAIKAKCVECIYDPHGGGGTVLEQIARCTSTTCPLYQFRPKTTKQKREEKAARDATLTNAQLDARRAATIEKLRSKHD